MNNEEIKKYRKARLTIDSCIDDAVKELLEISFTDDLTRQRMIRLICWQLAEDSIDAYVGNLELDIEEYA
jgi:hypothetical protein